MKDISEPKSIQEVIETPSETELEQMVVKQRITPPEEYIKRLFMYGHEFELKGPDRVSINGIVFVPNTIYKVGMVIHGTDNSILITHGVMEEILNKDNRAIMADKKVHQSGGMTVIDTVGKDGIFRTTTTT